MKFIIHKKTKKEIFIEIIYVILIFQIALQCSPYYLVAKIFNYADDIIAFICFIYVTIKYFSKTKIDRLDKKILLVYLLFIIVGIVSSMKTQLQSPLVCLSDLFTCSKFILGYLAVRIYSRKWNFGFFKKSVLGTTKFLVVIYFILAIHDEFMSPYFEIFDYRLFGKSIQLFYPHPTYLAAACIVFLIILSTTNKKNENLVYMIMASVIILFTFRAKAISFVAIFWGLYLMIDIWKIKSKIIYFFASIILAGYLAYDQFLTYFMSTTWSARSVLFKDAVIIAKRYFPFGAGFATFGTNMSVVSYSPLYYEFGYDQINGMSKATAAYLNDGFWQACIAQFGAFGVILFIILIYLFLKKVTNYNIQNIGSMRYISIISLNIYLIIASVGELAYFAPYALLYFGVLGIVLSENDKIILGKKEN